MTSEPSQRDRTRPECGSVFGAVADLGQCPRCKAVSRASSPGRVIDLNVYGADPDWPAVAPFVERLRLVDRPLPAVQFSRLRHLTLYGRAIDHVEGSPKGSARSGSSRPRVSTSGLCRGFVGWAWRGAATA